jgi:hypothetical protein
MPPSRLIVQVYDGDNHERKRVPDLRLKARHSGFCD